jgi:tetratricopeptide (TPR) repeat protein
LSFQQVGKTEKERTMIGHFLTLSAFFNASDVGEDLFSVSLDMEDEPCMWSELFTSGGAWDPYKYEDTIVELSNLSLLQRVDVESTASNFSLHPLVADWLKLRTDQKGREDCTIEAISLLAEYIDKQDGDKLPFEAKQYLLAHMDACLYNDQEYLKDLDKREIAGRKMAYNFALYYKILDRYLEAETLYQRALAGYEKTLGLEHTTTLDTVNNLGTLYRKQGKQVEAETLYQRALAGKEKALGLEHTSTLKTVNNLGVLYKKQGKLVKAEDIYQRVLAGREKKLGPEHTATLDVVYNLGLLYQNQGKLVEAEAMYQRGLAGRKKTLGPEHKSTLKAADALENLYQE